MSKSLPLVVVFMLVACQKHGQSRDTPESDGVQDPPKTGELSDHPQEDEQSNEVDSPDKKPVEKPADKTPDVDESKLPQDRTFFQNVYKTADGALDIDDISGCIEVVSSLPEPKPDLAILSFIGNDAAGPWAVGTCKELLSAKDGIEETSLGRCEVDPRKKIQGPGVSDEPSRFISYFKLHSVPESGTDPISLDKNTSYQKENNFFVILDKFKCDGVAYNATKYVMNQPLIDRLKAVKLFN